MKRAVIKRDNVFIGLYVSRDIARKLAYQCQKLNITISEAVREIIKEYIKEAK